MRSMVSNKDRDIIYSLGSRVREIAELAEMRQRKERWYDHNALKAGRPLVLCFPEGAWVELLPDDELQCISVVL